MSLCSSSHYHGNIHLILGGGTAGWDLWAGKEASVWNFSSRKRERLDRKRKAVRKKLSKKPKLYWFLKKNYLKYFTDKDKNIYITKLVNQKLISANLLENLPTQAPNKAETLPLTFGLKVSFLKQGQGSGGQEESACFRVCLALSLSWLLVISASRQSFRTSECTTFPRLSWRGSS